MQLNILMPQMFLKMHSKNDLFMQKYYQVFLTTFFITATYCKYM